MSVALSRFRSSRVRVPSEVGASIAAILRPPAVRAVRSSPHCLSSRDRYSEKRLPTGSDDANSSSHGTICRSSTPHELTPYMPSSPRSLLIAGLLLALVDAPALSQSPFPVPGPASLP